MNTLIISGGTIDDEFATAYIAAGKWNEILAADRGLEFCRRTGLVPDLILGDFDSADPDAFAYMREQYGDRLEIYPCEKDETDTELALRRAMERGAESVTILGATGTRLDHVLGNFQLLKKALDHDVSCCLVDAHNRIRMTDKPMTLKKEDQFGTYVSLLPFTPCVTGLTLQGFAYCVDDFTLVQGEARGVSNELAEGIARITFTDGLLLVIESRD